MLRRKIYDDLVNWKKTKRKECLLIKGARQVGKTYIVDRFARQNYKSYIYINFLQNPAQKKIFDGELSPKIIYQNISLYADNVNFIDGDTLIFFDEIQECPNARTALKFLAIDNRYDVISSGSLLGINYKEIASVPVGYEKQMEMFSLDFEEFLLAMGKNDMAISTLKESFLKREKVEPELNEMFLSLLRTYIVIGGMPEVINTFLKTNNYQSAYATQKKIIDSYYDDIDKYATIPERQKIRDCYNSIPRQLAREYKKFQYSVVSKGSTAKKYGNSINWLIDAALVGKCVNVSIPMFPTSAYEIENEFKIYCNDTGLLTAIYGYETQKSIVTNKLKGPAKGGIYENLIYDILTKKGYKLRYYKKQNSETEIEFLLDRDAEVIPVEVKSKNGATLSLNSFIEEYAPSVAYKLISGNVGVADTKVTLPLYMAMFL